MKGQKAVARDCLFDLTNLQIERGCGGLGSWQGTEKRSCVRAFSAVPGSLSMIIQDPYGVRGQKIGRKINITMNEMMVSGRPTRKKSLNLYPPGPIIRMLTG